MNTRRKLLGWFAGGLAFAAGWRAQAAVLVEVYRSSSCGCCEDWIEHLRANGFTVRAHDVDDTRPYRRRFHVPVQLASCHTAVVAGYAIEGHVPAREIRRLLAERPKAQGLAVPDMPIGSPGMEGPKSEPYDVLLFQRDGSHVVYASYGR